MAGHNKWSKIKHKKAATDAKKSKEFTKVVQLLKIESKKAGGNVDSPGLKTAIEKAKSVNMPKENIERAIASGSGTGDTPLEEVIYETYGPGGSAVIIQARTDNTNRTAPEIRHLLSKNGYTLATPGSASWAFEQQDGVWTPTSTVDLEEEDTQKLQTLVSLIEEHEDVESVYTNVTS